MIAAIKQIPELLAHLVESIQRLSQIVQEGQTTVAEGEHLRQRIEKLERENRGILAEAEALVTRAEGKLAAARGAEERARGMVNRAERVRESLGGDETGEEPIDQWLAQLQGGNGGGGAPEGVPPMHPGLEDRPAGKDAAKAYKWGG